MTHHEKTAEAPVAREGMAAMENESLRRTTIYERSCAILSLRRMARGYLGDVRMDDPNHNTRSWDRYIEHGTLPHPLEEFQHVWEAERDLATMIGEERFVFLKDGRALTVECARGAVTIREDYIPVMLPPKTREAGDTTPTVTLHTDRLVIECLDPIYATHCSLHVRLPAPSSVKATEGLIWEGVLAPKNADHSHSDMDATRHVLDLRNLLSGTTIRVTRTVHRGDGGGGYGITEYYRLSMDPTLRVLELGDAGYGW